MGSFPETYNDPKHQALWALKPNLFTRLAKAVVHFRCIKGVTDGLCEHSRACEDCDFFASTSRDKKFPLRAARSLESTNREQRALVIFRLQQSI